MSKNEVSVGGETYTADHILVAVGGKPTMPDMEGPRRRGTMLPRRASRGGFHL